MTEHEKRLYGGDWNEKYLYIVGIALTCLLITTSLMGLKFFEVGGVKFGAGMIFFPFCLIIGDILSEVYGFKKARQIIIAALCARIFMFVSATAVVALPPAEEWHNQQAFETIFGSSPRLIVASSLAYLTGELSNSYVMTKMKVQTNGRYFWLRAMASTVIGEMLNSMVYQFSAFGGKMPSDFLAQVVVNGTILKVGIEALVLPVTAYICIRLKQAEGIDYFDEEPEEAKLVQAT